MDDLASQERKEEEEKRKKAIQDDIVSSSESVSLSDHEEEEDGNATGKRHFKRRTGNFDEDFPESPRISKAKPGQQVKSKKEGQGQSVQLRYTTKRSASSSDVDIPPSGVPRTTSAPASSQGIKKVKTIEKVIATEEVDENSPQLFDTRSSSASSSDFAIPPSGVPRAPSAVEASATRKKSKDGLKAMSKEEVYDNSPQLFDTTKSSESSNEVIIPPSGVPRTTPAAKSSVPSTTNVVADSGDLFGKYV